MNKKSSFQMPVLFALLITVVFHVHAEEARADGLVVQQLEAEQAVLHGQIKVRRRHPGFTGTGYARFVGEGTITWTVDVPAPALYQLEFRYAVRGTRPLNIRSQGVLIKPAEPFPEPKTGGFDIWQTFAVFAQLEAGRNTIEVSTTGHSGPNIDYLLVSLTPPDPQKFLTFPIHSSHEIFPGTAQNAEAYYQTIDPRRRKTTFEVWKQANEFNVFGNDARDAHATYLNGADLNFGRDMFVKYRSDGGVASYVQNYPTVQDAVNGTNLLATVAFEYGPPVDDNGVPIPNRPQFTTFYVFDKTGARVTKVDLDGRGEKFIPGLCNVCHGGKPKPVHPVTGKYQDSGDTGAQWIPWDLDTFGFAPRFTKDAQQAEFKKLNTAILHTNPTDATTILIEGWYGGQGLPHDTFDGSFVPPGWNNTAEGDKRALYLKVVAPMCRSCHNQRGTYHNSGHIIFQGEPLQTDLEFNTFSQFKEFKDEIESLVYDQALMPLARRTFENFWRSSAPKTLDDELFDGRSHQNPPADVYSLLERSAFGELRRPGRPIAKISGASRADILAPIGVSAFGFLPDFPSGHAIRLIGGPSQFAESFLWSVRDNQDLTKQFVVERENTTPAFFNADDTDKQYRIRLAVTNQFARAPGISGFNDIAEAVVFTNSTLHPLNFIKDIYPLLTERFPHNRNSSNGGASCVECHSTNVIRGRANGIFNLSLPNVNEVRFAYEMVLTRIDCNDPENSLILKKTAGHHHYAGTVQGFEHFSSTQFSFNGERRETVLRWIMEGASLDGSGQTLGCPLPTLVGPNP
jgi:hypothetical protein